MTVTTDAVQTAKMTKRLRFLRREIREHLERIEDVDFLKVVLRMCEERTVYRLSPEEREAIERGLKQIESGRFITQEEMDARVERCLGKE